MLVLSRKLGEKLCIGSDIIITLVEVKGNRIKIGIDAPEKIAVLRSELHGAREKEDKSLPVLALADEGLMKCG